MGELMPRPRDAMRIVRDADPLAPQLPRAVRRAVDRESAWGLVSAARAQAAEYVAEARIEAVELAAERGMVGLDRLHRIEAALAKADPVKADRYTAYVEAYQAITLNEIRQLPREF
jgi:hypothetical protein